MGENNRILQTDANIQGACESLMEHVHNITDDNKKRQIQTLQESGVVIGYRRTFFHTFARREIFVKVPGYKIDDLTEGERERIITAVFNVFLVPGASMPIIIHPQPDTMALRQDYIPMIPVERSPGLVSIAGGFNA